ncbi:hypothetical protein ACEWY4_022681 [Coilia grayii]|uniref:Uncharacterized protein n=1 Tax=Coilia grayii TaxID=363190 RepID=A0ABD1J0W6_9TELE
MEVQCSLHREKLKLFCLEDQQLVCLVCRDSEAHRDHSFSPFNEAAPANKEDLTIRLEPLREKLRIFIEFKLLCEQTAMHIEIQSQHTQRCMRDEFEKLHQFLLAEEAWRMTELAEEQKKKAQAMKKKIDKVTKDISTLLNTIRAIEDEIATNDIMTQCPLQNPEKAKGTLINEAKYLGNLAFKVWDKMKSLVKFTPVILDPNTASYSLVLSEDLTSMVRADDRQWLPDNPERFDVYISVLGYEGMNSGVHSWEVEVGNNPLWLIGVMSETLSRKGDYNTMAGLRYVCYKDGGYWVRSTPLPKTPLRLESKLKRIRLELDWDQGTLLFSDPDTNAQLITFTRNFTETVFPYFSTNGTLKILPLTL